MRPAPDRAKPMNAAGLAMLSITDAKNLPVPARAPAAPRREPGPAAEAPARRR
ncbi:hypothetical protein KRM28CT15_63750 [Krasilnikovia sp. M28-CT-15]